MGAARNASFTSSTITSRLEAVGAKGYRRSWAAHPDAIVQCSVDFLGPLVSPPTSTPGLELFMGGLG